MKNQYFGDINDYKKYGLLRVLSNSGEISIGVCWMLTESDGRTDGQFLSYLDQADRWQRFDPELFDYLFRQVRVNDERNVLSMEGAGVLPATNFYSTLLSDSIDARFRYFDEMREQFCNVDLVFFDPDNGLEVPSKPIGQKNSNKYLYWHELNKTYSEGHSVLVYQHFIREKRDDFIKRLVDSMRLQTGASEVYVFRTPQVLFLLASQPDHVDHFRHQTKLLRDSWEDRIFVHPA